MIGAIAKAAGKVALFVFACLVYFVLIAIAKYAGFPTVAALMYWAIPTVYAYRCLHDHIGAVDRNPTWSNRRKDASLAFQACFAVIMFGVYALSWPGPAR